MKLPVARTVPGDKGQKTFLVIEADGMNGNIQDFRNFVKWYTRLQSPYMKSGGHA
jgi:hypothetical protein